MKMNGRAYMSVCLLATLMVCAAAHAGSSTAPPVKVDVVVGGDSVRLEAKSTGAFEYATYRPTLSLFVVDLAGVSAEGSTGARVLKSDIVSSYRVMQYRSGDRSIVRLEVLMRRPVEPQVLKTGEGELVITFAGEGATVAPIVSPAATKSRSAATPTTPAASVLVEPVSKAPASLIQNVSVSSAGDQTLVRITGNGHLAYDVLRLGSPERLVLDFARVRVGSVAKAIPSTTAPVRGVRVAQFKPDVVRIVVDLEKGAPYSVTTSGNSMTVSFGGPSRAQTDSAPLREPQPVVAEAEKTELAQKTESEARAGLPEAVPTGLTAKEIITLPVALTSSGAALASPKPAAAPSGAPAESPQPEPQQRAQAQAGAGQQAGTTRYGGEPISVNFKDVDLKDFFRLIHEISGLNVVVDPAVRGSMTIVLEDVPWDQALDIALKNNSLDKQLEGNVLRIATKSTLKKEAEERRDLAKAEAEAVPIETTTRVLSYAKATSLRDTLKRFLSPRGEILADERSNTLIVRDIPSVFPAIFGLVDQLDRKTQQVEIEARVVAASRTFSREVGVRFGFATSAASGRTVFGGLTGNSDFVSPVERGPSLPAPPLVASGTNSIPLNTNLGANTPTSGFTIAHSSPNVAVDLIISAAEARGVGKLLSKPKIVTQNNEQGVVKQGTKIPIQTVVNNTITVQYIDAVLRLQVTPQITAEGTVFMDVVVENTAIDAGIPRVAGIPALSTQEATTKVTLANGGTVVIGGVIISSQRTDVAQVPLLGSIPAIGHLFRHTTVSSSSQELLFFLTPRILPD